MEKNCSKIKYLIALILVFFVPIACLFVFNGTIFKAKAEEPLYSAILPLSPIYYSELNNPSSVCYFDGNYAVIEDQTLSVFIEGENAPKKIEGFTSLKQVKAINGQLLVSDNGTLFSIDLNTLSKNTLFDEDDYPVGGNYFDVNGSFLITAYNSLLQIYTYTENTVKKCSQVGDLNMLFPIALNENNQVFYVKNGTNSLYCLSFSYSDGIFTTNIAEEPLISVVAPSQMIADGNSVYYIENQVIKKLSVIDKTITEFSDNEEDFELGKILSPKDIAFKGDNLLVSDSTLNAVTEFKENGENLEFTGLAINSGKTAFNRVINAKKIDKNKNALAVLDENKVMIISDINGDLYDRNNFINILFNDLNVKNVSSLSLGENNLFFIAKTNEDKYSLYCYDLKTNNLFVLDGYENVDNVLLDITFANGNFYLLSSYSVSYVYKISDTDLSITTLFSMETVYNAGSLIKTDNLINVYIYNSSSEKIENYLFLENYETAHLLDYVNTENITDFNVDSAFSVFVLSEDHITVYPNNSSVSFDLPFTVKGFDFDFVSDNILCLTDKSLYSFNIPVFSLNDVADNFSFITDSETINPTLLKTCSTIENVLIYSFDITDGGLIYKENFLSFDNYLIYCEKEITADYNGESKTVNFVYLLDKNSQGKLIINAIYDTLSLTTKTNAEVVEGGFNTFIATKVCGYSLPFLTVDQNFVTNAVLNKGESFYVYKTVKVLDKEFYYGRTENNETVYIPITFTAKVLYEDFGSITVKLVSVKKCSVFNDENKELVLVELKKGTKVKLLNKNEISKIAYYDENNGVWIEGYIDNSSIITENNNPLKNVLVIVSITLCVLITTLFIVFRKKRTE